MTKIKYGFTLQAEVSTPLYHPITDQMVDLDIATGLIREVGNDDNSGAGFGLRDASGPVYFATLEEARQWVEKTASYLQTLFPKVVFSDCPPSVCIWAIMWLLDDPEDEWEEDWHADFVNNYSGLEWTDDDCCIQYVSLDKCQMVKVDPERDEAQSQQQKDTFRDTLLSAGDEAKV